MKLTSIISDQKLHDKKFNYHFITARFEKQTSSLFQYQTYIDLKPVCWKWKRKGFYISFRMQT